MGSKNHSPHLVILHHLPLPISLQPLRRLDMQADAFYHGQSVGLSGEIGHLQPGRERNQEFRSIPEGGQQK